jgi:hypothetical protein
MGASYELGQSGGNEVMAMVHVDKMFRVVNDWIPLFEGERRKTVILIQTTLKNISNQIVELPTLYDMLMNSPADDQTKKDAVKMVRVLYNTLDVNDEEQTANEAYLKEVRKKRKPLSAVVVKKIK